MALTERERKALEKSWAKIFADEIFPAIDEERFSVLYCDQASRPNAPVNVIIGALIIKELFDYSDDEIVENLMLDLHLQYALHTTSFAEQPISDKTLSRFRKRCYDYETLHKIFENKLNQDFHAGKPNQKWCTDCTYLFLKNGDVRYNCAIIDLHDRSVVASITDRHITSDLAVRTLQKALDSQRPTKGCLILHSDQGSQYTSKAFTEFCESVQVIQSMSKAGYPYDNAPMERYFNTLKNECTNIYEFRTEEELYQTVEEFAYVTYNHVRPHSYNDYRTPYQTRMAA